MLTFHLRRIAVAVVFAGCLAGCRSAPKEPSPAPEAPAAGHLAVAPAPSAPGPQAVASGSGAGVEPPSGAPAAEPKHEPEARECPMPGKEQLPKSRAEADARIRGGGPADQARKQAIARCAACHPRVYEAWKKGPHAFAYEAVQRNYRWAYDPSSPMSADGRTLAQEEHITAKHVCGPCHFPAGRVFESKIDLTGTPAKAFDYELMCMDRDEEILTSGVDCITCHVQGDRVLTRADYVPGEALAAAEEHCNPTPSAAFSGIHGCVPCHVQADHYEAVYRQDREAGEVYDHCDRCHLERDEAGAGTHYYYWSFNEAKIQRLVKPVFEKMTYAVQRGAKGRTLDVRWVHDFAPHSLGNTPRLYIVRFDVVDQAGASHFTTQINFYDEEESGNPQVLRKHNPIGELTTLLVGDSFERSYELPESVGDVGAVRRTVLVKHKFDYVDTAVTPVLSDERPFRL